MRRPGRGSPTPTSGPGYNEGVLTATEARPKAKAAAEKAIALDDDSAEAHTSLANFKLWYEYDWAGAESEFRRAFALNPNYAFAHDQFGIGLAFQGRFDEAIAEGKRAAALDPLSPQIPLDSAIAFGLARASTRAAGRWSGRAPISIRPSSFLRGWTGGSTSRRAGPGRHPETPEGQGDGIARRSCPRWLAYAYGASGDRAAALAELEDLKKKSLRGTPSRRSTSRSCTSASAIARARSTPWRRRTPRTRSGWAGSGSTTTFDPLRSEPRFQALLKKLRLAK